jgi:hypothetical protein
MLGALGNLHLCDLCTTLPGLCAAGILELILQGPTSPRYEPGLAIHQLVAAARLIYCIWRWFLALI